MTKSGEGKSGGVARATVRAARLADKLRQNLAKRKTRARAARDAARLVTTAEPSDSKERKT
jgi:uncharacterized protein YbjT (DUF2867 family)